MNDNKNVDIKFNKARRISGIPFIIYAQSRKLVIPNDFKIFWRRTKAV
jgi:hypothetical protein